MIDHLVTGAAGQLGRTVLRLAAARGENALGADVPGTGLTEVSVDDREQVMRWVHEHRPRTVLHLGAWTDVDGCERDPDKAARINGQGTAHVVDACRAVGCGLVYVSTDFVFDGSAIRPIPVEAPPAPLSHYGRSKLAGERAVLGAGAPRFAVVRTSWVFGPGGNNFPRKILAKARDLLRGPPDAARLTVVSDQRGRPTLTDDLAAAVLDVAAAGGEGVYHASNEGECSFYEFARDILRESGIRGVEVAPIPSTALPVPARRPAYSVLDTSRLAALRGRPMPHYLDALRRYLREELK